MIQLIYASAATQPFTSHDLKSLLTKARARNTLYAVSGMLLYQDGSFLQVLEGPEAGVETILAAVYKDKRHTGARTLGRSTIARREFESWSMGFTDTSNALTQPAGHIDYLRGLSELADAEGKARRYLRFFQQGMYRQTAKPGLSLTRSL